MEVQPVFDRIDFYGLDLRDFAVQAQKRKVSMANGRVGIIMRYPAKSRPLKVNVTWDKFNKETMRSVDAVAFAYQEVKKVSFSMFLEKNVYSWQATDSPELPAVTNVDLADPRYHVEPATVAVPVVTTVCLLIALIAACLSLVRRSKGWLMGTAVLLGAVGCSTSSIGKVDVVSPLSDRGDWRSQT